MSNFTPSQDCITIIQSFEGCELTAYQDQNGIWTIGTGHTGAVEGQPVMEGQTITQEQANEFLQEDLQATVSEVNNLVSYDGLTQGMFDALVDFCYNEGSGNLSRSTLLRDLNAGDINGASQQFLVWDYAGGQVSGGLLRRRGCEQACFLGNDYTQFLD